MDETGFQMGVASTTKVFFFFFSGLYILLHEVDIYSLLNIMARGAREMTA